MAVVGSPKRGSDDGEVAALGEGEEGPAGNVEGRISGGLISEVGQMLEGATHAAVKAEKRKQASRNPGRALMPAFSTTTTKGDRAAV